MVGLTEEQARVRAAQQDFELGKSTGHFRANSKALAENEGDGIAKVTSSTTVLLLLSPILCYATTTTSTPASITTTIPLQLR